MPIGSRQAEILERLAAGPYSLNALVNAIDPTKPSMTLHALKRLEVAGLVTVTGRKSRRRLTGAVVALAVEPPVAAEAVDRRPGSTVSEAFAAFEALLR
jgi:hypothetical protein